MIYRYLLLAVVIPVWLVFASSNKFYKLLQQNENGILIEFQFPEIEILNDKSANNYSIINIPGLIYNYEKSQPLLPVLSSSIIAPPGKITWEIVSSDIDFFKDLKPIVYETADAGIVAGSSAVLSGVSPKQILYLNETGIFRDYRVIGLQLFPVQAVSGGIKFYKKLVIRIRFGNKSKGRSGFSDSWENNLFENFAINGNQKSSITPAVSYQTQTVSGPLSPGFNSQTRLKMFVEENGIYQVTGADLVNAGIDIQSMNPQTFRLSNRGQDVALYVFGDQDQVFDESDFFEFWGEPNEKTFLSQFPDLYSDPFTDENVYWLEWNGSPGLRMVEESGAIVQTNPTQYNTAQFYEYTVHFEQDKYFERLGYGNIRKPSYSRDHWFFDSGIQAIGKKKYPVELIYPDSSSFVPVRVKLMLSGKSRSSHTMLAWLNESLIGEVHNNWVGQDYYLLDNSQYSNIRTIDLAHAENDLEIQMPSLPAGGESDGIFFNWAEITYDRQYKAFNNLIEFQRPSPSVIYYPAIKLFQFEIENFTSSDIEIYKKDVSKIVNYNLNVTGTGGNTRYKVTFQDNIFSNDVRYLAITKDKKLKPERIKKEEPFDPTNPNLALKSSSNSADYLIITHNRFYDRVKELADIRRQQGLNVIVVKVQDIYDEFNYGIKSPLAIKNMLRYAFYNWDRTHRLKYVLLFGDANFNYKAINTTFEDYVPTLFFQTQKFGAVATDLPYSLIAGDDYLPDIFIGRIPAATNGDVTNVIEKIKEHEQNPVIGPWRNQTLFVSGNDSSTFEFSWLPNIPQNPAFRTQNQRIINMLLPKNLTSFKLNTIKDENLQFDPNFGGTTDLIEYIDDGIGFMNFLGHGGGAIWADVTLLNLRDIDRLNNKGKYPFIASMTCFTGAFDNPGNPGLAQKMILAPERGALGFLASSGLGWLANDYVMLWNFSKYLFQNEMSVGEAYALGKIDYFITTNYVMSDTLIPSNRWDHASLRYDMSHQYNLLSDPYLFVKFPTADLTIGVDNDVPLPGDTVNVQITSNFTSAEGYLEFSNGKNEVISREPLFYSGGQVSQQVFIPDNFERSAGYIRAYLAQNNQDASGMKQIGINYAVFDSVRTIPQEPNATDSVAIQMVVKDGIGISKVVIKALMPENIVPGDTVKLEMTQVGTNTYRSVNKIPPTFSIATIYYFVYAKNLQGQVSRMSFQYQVKETRPDPMLFTEKIRLTGKEKVKLGVSVGNSGEVNAQNIPLSVYNGKINYQQNLPFNTTVMNILGKDSTTVELDFPLPLNVPSYDIYAVIDPAGIRPDFNLQNNIDSVKLMIDRINLTPDLGSTYNNTNNDTITIGGYHRFWLGQNQISKSSAAALRLEEISELQTHEGLSPVKLSGTSKPTGLKIVIFNDEAELTAPFLISLGYDKTSVDTNNINVNDLKLYKWNKRLQAWTQQDAAIDTAFGCIRANLSDDGFYAPFISGDDQAPKIELTVDGRNIRSKSLVAAKPVLNVVLEDESGLQIEREEIHILINGIEVPDEKVNIPDSVRQSKLVGITVYPELDIGRHDLSITVKDINGNESNKVFSLKVTDEFELKVFGNYPNPFSEVTIFSYFINSPEIIDDFEIRIFTVSGRLIKRIKNDINTLSSGEDVPRRHGYGELTWDGTDKDGNQVANGVYFALIRAKYQGSEKEEILKVARLR